MATIKVKPLSAMLLDTAPDAGSGLHRWLIKGARMCQMSGVKPDRAFDLIAATVIARGGEIIPRSIRQAIEKAYSQPFASGKYEKRPEWPEPDLELIEKLTLLRAWDVPGALATLESRSPEKPNQTTGEIIQRLFPRSSLVAAGFEMWDTAVYELPRIALNLHKWSLIVPSPMLAQYGLTQKGKQSGRCLSNTGPRRFLVTEFDFKPTNKQGDPTIWVPLINLWQSHGMTVQDACAAIVMHLAQYGPLTMVVFSGNISLHAWWRCEGEPEHEGSRLHKFMRYAAMLGADTATYTRSQFVRMPGATRPDGRKQTVHYLDTKGIEQ